MSDKRAELLRRYRPMSEQGFAYLCRALGITQEQAIAWLRAEGHDV